MTKDVKLESEKARLLLAKRQLQRGFAAIPFIAVAVLMSAEVFLNWRFVAPEVLFFAAFPTLVLALPFHHRAVKAQRDYFTASKDLRATE